MSRYKGRHTAEKEPKPKKQKRPSRLTRQQKILIAICAVLAVALVAVLVYKSLVVRPDLTGRSENNGDTQQEEIDYGDGVRPRADGERKSDDFYTILILGRDTGGGGNTDTMLLASYDVTNQKATVMSIPRDTMVNVSWDVKKINSVYSTYGGGDKGIQALYKEIAQLVGFEPDYQVVVEWEAVGQIVDAIGGVWFDVPYDMYYTDPFQDLVIDQAKGYRLLNGDDAMQVIRWRKNNGSSGVGDSGRMEIQQNFLKAVIQQLLTIQNVTNINKIAKAFQDNVETDMNFQNILWFAQQAVFGGLKVEDVEFLTMPYKGASAWSRSYQQNLSYVVPVANELLDIVNNKLSPFKEVFTLSDLDIMYVNSDGSIGSTTGHVEDAKAAVPPVKPAQPSTDPVPEEPVTENPDEEPSGGEPETPPATGGETGSGGEDPVTPPTGGEENPTSPGDGETGASGGEPETPADGGDSGGSGGGIDWTVLPAEPGEPAA